MSEDILTELAHIISRHPWWQARASLMLALLQRMKVHPPASVLDAGCGWGVNFQALERHGYNVDGLDISRRVLERLDRPGRELFEADLTQSLPATARTYDAVIALDVIEHVDDDHAVLTGLARLTKPGGVCMVSVPALPELYSEFDAVQGHRRRYLPETLCQAFQDCGLRLERMLWWGSWMVPVMRRQRSRVRPESGQTPPEVYRSYLSLPPWPLRSVLRLAFAFDHLRTLWGKNKRGSSLFALARHA
jgi:SAM-dependent methyltransferase